MWTQIASALSRPEEAAAAHRLSAFLSEAQPDAESLLSPDEALHSIHEEPDEASSGPKGSESNFSAQGVGEGVDQPKQDHSREPSFAQLAAGLDRQGTQPSSQPGKHT